MKYCPICDREVESIVRIVSEAYPVKGEDITIDAHVRFCVHCGEEMWDEELDAQNLLDAFTAYRRKHNLLQPAEIRATREKYGLSQTAFARVLGFGDKTITRYENGSIADAAQNNLIYLAQEPRNFKTLLEKNKDRISHADYEAADAALEELRCRVIYPMREKTYSYSTSAMNINYWGDRRHA